jgi:hypothetical protein
LFIFLSNQDFDIHFEQAAYDRLHFQSAVWWHACSHRRRQILSNTLCLLRVGTYEKAGLSEVEQQFVDAHS